MDLNSTISLAIKLDQHLRDKCHCTMSPIQSAAHPHAVTAAVMAQREDLGAFPDDAEKELIQLGSSWLSETERGQLSGGLCLYCGGAGHLLSRCPLQSSKS